MANQINIIIEDDEIKLVATPAEVSIVESDTLVLRGDAGGDLTGTYPNPEIAPAAIDNDKVAEDAAISYSKLALDESIQQSDLAFEAATTTDVSEAVEAETDARLDSEDEIRTAAVGGDLSGNLPNPVVAKASQGFVVGTDEGTKPKPDDVVFGAFPYSTTDEHQVTKPGFHYLSDLGRTRLAGAIEVGEIEDPPELIFLRQSGQFPWGPMGATALLAADVTSGSNIFYLTTRKGFPYNAPAGVAPSPVVPFLIGTQQIAYTDHGAHRATLCGVTSVGATSIPYAAATFDFPTAGFGPIGTEMLQWTGQDFLLDTTTSADVKAGDNTLPLVSVTGLPTSGVVNLTGSIEMNVSYTGITGTTLTGVTGIRRNVSSGSRCRVNRLTGVTHCDYVDIPVIRAASVGADKLRLLTRERYQAWWNTLPTSGSARISLWHNTTVLTISWTGKDATTGELTGVTGITTAIPYGSALTYFATTNLPVQTQHNSLSVLEIGRFTGASGFTSAATKGSFAEFSPRSKSPTPKETTTGIIHWDPWASGGGQQSRSGGIHNKVTRDVTGPKEYGGYTVIAVTTDGPNSFRRDTMVFAPTGNGVLGGGIQNHNDIAHPWHVAGPGARSVNQVMASELRLSDTNVGWPTSGRIQLSVWNRQTNAMETREFDYTGLNSDHLGFTGVTYDGTGGFVLGDFYAEEAWIRLGDRVKFTAIVSRRQVMANEGGAGETTIGNVGPTTASPEPGIKMGSSTAYRDALTGGMVIPHPEINSAGKTSAQIDALFTTTPPNGAIVSDPTNGLLLVRQAGKWAKTAALTTIS